MENRIPLFEKGRVLKKETLEQLRDYPVDLNRLYWAEYSDGIISGFSVEFQDGMLKVGGGILKHGGLVFWMREDETVPLAHYGVDCRLYLTVEETVKAEDYYANCFSLALYGRGGIPNAAGYELGRFHLKEGAVLRTGKDYLDFQDTSTLVNTLGLYGRRYAGRSGYTLSPQLTRLYGQELLPLDTRTSLDEAFCMACLSGGIVEYDAIAGYLSASGGFSLKEGSTQELYQGLLKLLNQRKKAQGQGAQQHFMSSRRTMIE